MAINVQAVSENTVVKEGTGNLQRITRTILQIIKSKSELWAFYNKNVILCVRGHVCFRACVGARVRA